MRLFRFGEAGKESPGILTSTGVRKDLSKHFRDWDRAFFNSGGLQKLRDIVNDGRIDSHPDVPKSARWGRLWPAREKSSASASTFPTMQKNPAPSSPVNRSSL
jgi:hypothetical protein